MIAESELKKASIASTILVEDDNFWEERSCPVREEWPTGEWYKKEKVSAAS